MGTGIKLINTFVYSILLLLYGVTIYIKFYHPAQHWINHYGADLLCMPIVFGVAEGVIRKLKRQPQFKLSALQLVVGVLYFALLFEVLLPQLSSKYTADGLDVIAYSLGGLGFFLYRLKINGR